MVRLGARERSRLRWGGERLQMKDDNARLRAAIDKLRVPIYIKDPRGRYVYANDLACELLERLRSDVLGRSRRRAAMTALTL